MAFVLVLTFAICLAIPAEAPKKEPDPPESSLHEVPLSVSLKKYLADKLPEYRLVNQADYDQVWFNPESEYNALGEDWFNWSLCADFDGNGMDDFAILLLEAEADKPRVALVVARAVRKGWRHEILESYEAEIPLRLVIQLDPPGMKKFGNADDEDAPMKMVRNPSIIRDVLETDATLRYSWKWGKWREVFIGI